jgi:hypothetical protein
MQWLKPGLALTVATIALLHGIGLTVRVLTVGLLLLTAIGVVGAVTALVVAVILILEGGRC